MAHHGPKLIGVGRSTAVGVLKALTVGALPGAIADYAFDRNSDHIQLGWTLIVWGGASAFAFKAMTKGNDVPVGYYGVHLINGDMSGKVFGPGQHPLLPGEGVELVSGKDTPVDPPAFEDLAKDTVAIWFDGYFVVRIIDPVLHLARIDQGDALEAMRKLFEAEVRLFVTQWRRGADLIAQRELVKEFLMLNGNKDSAAARKLRAKLEALATDEGPLDMASVNNIMEDAGKFCGYAAQWGYDITEIHTEQIDLPPRLKEAAAKAAAEADEMKTYEIRQARRLAMIEELKTKYPDLSSRDAIVAIDTLLGLSVNRSIFELDVRGAEELIKLLGPRAKPLIDAVKKMIPAGKKGK